MDFVEEGLDEAGDLVVAADDHGQSWRLDTANGAGEGVVEGGGSAVVHADQPVKLGPGEGGGGEGVEVGRRAEAAEGLGDGVLGEDEVQKRWTGFCEPERA